MKRLQWTRTGFLMCGLLAAACAHSRESGAPATAPGPARVAPALPGEIRALGSSGPLVVADPCRAEDAQALPAKNQPQIELGLAFWRSGGSAARVETVPYAGFRCGSH